MTTPGAIEHTLARHAREHEALARLSQVALREHHVRTLIEEVVATVIDTLDLELCGVSRLREDEQALDIVVSVGPHEPPPMLPAGRGTQAGFALYSGVPVVSEDLETETRFDTTGLRSMGMRSGVSAIIEGEGRPFGVLSAHVGSPRRFSADDVNFLAAVANVLSAAVERRRREQAALHAQLHDPLTGLPNRTLALNHLDLALARRRRSHHTVALLLIDIDRFAIINEGLGHAAGDEVLRTLAGRLRGTLRASDTAARMTADEFAVVCESDDGVRDVVELAKRIGGELSCAMPIDGGERSFTTCVGIAVAENSKVTAASMLQHADAALCRAKKRGPGSHELFDPGMRSQMLARLRTETELRRAINEAELRVHYQPIVEAPSGRPVAVEALVRWEHPERGMVLPLDFIPVAEETGMIRDLGRFVLERACAQAAIWQRQFGDPLSVFVNVSGIQMTDPRFADEVAAIAKASGMQAGTLGIEVTESILIEDEGAATAILSGLREHGVRLLLDDFGTGYSSLSYLSTLPLDIVKIDRSFIDGLTDGQKDAAITRAIVDMCKALQLSTVAEGVESEAQLKWLHKLGCDFAQGYFLCHPMAPAEVGSFLAPRLRGEGPERSSVPARARS